jgi:hypothetical protein
VHTVNITLVKETEPLGQIGENMKLKRNTLYISASTLFLFVSVFSLSSHLYSYAAEPPTERLPPNNLIGQTQADAESVAREIIAAMEQGKSPQEALLSVLVARALAQGKPVSEAMSIDAEMAVAIATAVTTADPTQAAAFASAITGMAPTHAAAIASAATTASPSQAAAIASAVTTAAPTQAAAIASAVTTAAPTLAAAIAWAVTTAAPDQAAAIASAVTTAAPSQAQAIASVVIAAVPDQADAISNAVSNAVAASQNTNQTAVQTPLVQTATEPHEAEAFQPVEDTIQQIVIDATREPPVTTTDNNPASAP